MQREKLNEKTEKLNKVQNQDKGTNDHNS